MDDYSLSSLSESKNEWCSRLVNTLTPAIIEGLRSIFNESLQLCLENEEEDKYLMTFQTFLSRIPQWNENIIKTERERIEKTTNCGYLEELITCVHIIQLKALTCVRVGHKQKKVDIDIPSSDAFVHKVYINAARKIYTNIYLFEKDIPPLNVQKNNRELELIIKECILNSVRDTMPVDKILMAYMDETEEEDVVVEEKIIHEELKEPEKPPEVSLKKTEDKEPSKEEAKTTEPVVKKLEETKPIVVEKPVAVETPVATEKPVASEKPVATEKPVAAEKPSTPTPESVTTLSTHVIPTPPQPIAESQSKPTESISFSDTDSTVDTAGTETLVQAPKDIQHLEDLRRRREEEEEEEDDDEEEEKLKIGDSIQLEITDVNDLSKSLKLESQPVLDDIEILEPI